MEALETPLIHIVYVNEHYEPVLGYKFLLSEVTTPAKAQSHGQLLCLWLWSSHNFSTVDTVTPPTCKEEALKLIIATDFLSYDTIQ